MKRIKRWLKGKPSRPKVSIITSQPAHPVSVKHDDIALEDYTVELAFGADMRGRIDSRAPKKNVLMPDSDADTCDVTVPQPKVLDQSSPDVDKSAGFNPYATGVMKIKWGRKPR